MSTLKSETFGELDVVVNPDATGSDECRRRTEIQGGDSR
jgi:hypothetical protein